jgi:starch phosphorylase
MRNLSFIEEGESKKVRMANMCVAICHKVNGVAALHSEILKKSLFKDFVEYFNKLDYNKYKDKLINITNGVTPRRWVVCANPIMTSIITKKVGHSDWIIDYEKARDLEKFAKDPETQQEWAEMKKSNKIRLIKWVKANVPNVDIQPDVMFDVLVKRIHEYKRQLMNVLYVVHRYLWIKEMKPQDRANVVPRAVFIGGKAAPGYENAKKVIKLVNAIGNVINNDQEVGKLLKLVFLPNYSVSSAQVIIPAADLSQHISTAGTEASGTSNMKFAMNGSLIIGTLDGANVEIKEEIKEENMFIFGADVNAINGFKQRVFA